MAKRFDGFGIGGALDKGQLGTIVSWVNEILARQQTSPPAWYWST